MTAPKWLNAILQEFGAGIELRSFGLNDQNAAQLRFETGSTLRFEYAFESLVIAMTVPAAQNAELMKRLLIYTQPERRPSFKLRVGSLAKAGSVVFVARLAERIIVFDRGTVAMDGTPAEVFSHAEKLIGIGLNIPKAAQLALALRERNIPLPEGVFTHEQLLASLLALREGKTC